MRRIGAKRALAVLALGALAAATGFLVTLLVGGRERVAALESVPSTPREFVPALQARALLSPARASFGDTLTAKVDVTLDRARVDPASVRITTDFTPWRPVGRPSELRRDGKTTTHLRTTFVLRCLASVCLPPPLGLSLRFPPAAITFERLGAKPGEVVRKRLAHWPLLVVQTRLDTGARVIPRPGGRRSAFEFPWRADLVSMPEVTYRVSSGSAQIPLLAAGGILALAGVALAWIGRPRRRRQPPPEPVRPLEPELTPLERALALLEAQVGTDGAPDRRRALELVAAELAVQGDETLAQAARRLAWSHAAPELDRTRGIAERARPALGLDAEMTEDSA